MRNQPVIRLRLAALAAVAAVLAGLPACNGGERQLARNAAAKVFGSLGKETGEIKVAAAEVDFLASRSGASADDVSVVAGEADNYRGWTVPQKRVDRMAEIAREVKDDKIVSAGVGVACDRMTGKITDPATFQDSVLSATAGMAYTDAYAFREATNGLAEDLAQIKSQGTPRDKVAAGLLCYAYQVVPAK